MTAVVTRSFEIREVDGAGCFEELPIEGSDADLLVAKEASGLKGDAISWYQAVC